MTKLVRTSKGFKVEHNSEPKILHHGDWDWIVMLENANCYMAYQGTTYTVRAKAHNNMWFYTWDSSSYAYDVYKKVEVMDLHSF